MKGRGVQNLPDTHNFIDNIISYELKENEFQPAEQVPLVPTDQRLTFQVCTYNTVMHRDVYSIAIFYEIIHPRGMGLCLRACICAPIHMYMFMHIIYVYNHTRVAVNADASIFLSD